MNNNTLQKYVKIEKNKYNLKKKILNKTYNIIKELFNKYKKLNKKEKTILAKYKNDYYKNINTYIYDNNISYKDLINFISNKKNNNKFINLENLLNDYQNQITYDIGLLDNIIIKHGINKKMIVYRGLGFNKKDNLYNKILKTSTKVGNKIIIKNFQSTSIDIGISLGFTIWAKYNIILQIDTNNFPYFYLPWKIDSQILKKEKIKYSEFELLLQRNIELIYTGKEKIKILDIKNKINWNDYIKKKINLSDLYIYKFKINNVLNNNKLTNNVPIKTQKDITIPVNELSNIFINYNKNNKINKKK